MLNIVVPMAGRGSRFAAAGYIMPKPLIDVFGHPMIEYVVRNITPSCDHRFIFVCQQEHLDNYDLEKKLQKMAPGSVIIPIDHVTEGAACTVLLAKEYIDNDDAMMIANSDQYVRIDIDLYLRAERENDGLIMTMPADHPKWSYVRFDDEGYVTEVKEKEVISHEATVGIYNYRHGRDFVKYAKQMISRDRRVNNEFYVAPVYNEMIEDGKKIIYYNVGKENMFGLGVPDDLNFFMEQPFARDIF